MGVWGWDGKRRERKEVGGREGGRKWRREEWKEGGREGKKKGRRNGREDWNGALGVWVRVKVRGRKRKKERLRFDGSHPHFLKKCLQIKHCF